jgi:hypothetical protein
VKKEIVEKYEALARELQEKLTAKDELASRLATENKALKEKALLYLETLIAVFGEPPSQTVHTGIAGQQAKLIQAIDAAAAGTVADYPSPWPAVLEAVADLRADYAELRRRERWRSGTKRARKRRAKRPKSRRRG